MGSNNEIDISTKVKYIIKFGLAALIAVGTVVASVVWYVQSGSGDIVVQDAKVASTMVGVRAQTEGEVEQLLVQDGDQVEAGTVVAKLKVNVTPEQLQQLAQAVELSKNNLEQVKKGSMVSVPVQTPGGSNSAAIAAAQRRLDRMNQLLEMGAISANERDAAAAELAAAQAVAVPEVKYETRFQPSSPEAIKNAEMAVKQAEMALEAAKSSSQATEIVTNVAGTVYLADIEVGSAVKPGQVIMQIGDAESLWVEAKLPVDKLDRVKLGELVSYIIDRKNYQGTIMDIISPDDEPQDGNTDGQASSEDAEEKPKQITVKISIPADVARDMKPEQRAEVRFEN